MMPRKGYFLRIYLCFLVSHLHVCFVNQVYLTSSSLQSIYVCSVETNPNKFGRSDEACYICKSKIHNMIVEASSVV